MKYTPDYTRMNGNDFYSHEIDTEFLQCTEEGLYLTEETKDLFRRLTVMPDSEEKELLADALFDAISESSIRQDYPYKEPYDRESLSACFTVTKKKTPDRLRDRVAGAWYGRIAGCLLGKTVEGIRSEELVPFLQATGNYPMHRYITRADCLHPITENFSFKLRDRVTADTVSCAPSDDDTNYMVLALQLLQKKGTSFTPDDVLDNWVTSQPKTAYFTAERVALLNYMRGYFYPASACYKNQYREYIGAQIRVDVYGYICAGNPSAAAELAYRDASASHTKNGIYGAMYCASMIAAAATATGIEEIIETGLCHIPPTSRLADRVHMILSMYRDGKSFADCIARIRSIYDEHTGYGWCHTIPNACIVTAALLYGNGDYGKSICLAVQSAFDTDCNGATVGSVLGMFGTKDCIDACWLRPLQGRLETEIVKTVTVDIEEMIDIVCNIYQ